MGAPELIWSDPVDIDGKEYVLPLLLDGDCRVVKAVSDWLRHLSASNVADKTIRQYAYTLKNFWSDISRKKVNWENVFDRHLRNWRNSDVGVTGKKKGLKKRTVNTKLETVLRFYVWAQQRGYIQGVIGELSIEHRCSPQIAITIHVSRGRKIISSDLLYRIVGTEYKPVPTQADMDTAFIHVSDTDNVPLATRNVLLLRWGSEAGLRREEMQRLTLEKIPSLAIAQEYEDEGKVVSISVVGKGGKTRLVPVSPSLLLATAEYIRYERAHALVKLKNPLKSQNVFISHTMGKTLALRTMTEIGSRALQQGDSKLTLHRTRARFACRFFATEIQAEFDRKNTISNIQVETLLFRLAEIMGHEDIATLRYYLRLECKMFIQSNPTA